MSATPSPRDDDPTAPIAALFDEHCGFVYRVLHRHGVHDASLDDAVQDVFVTAYRRWASFEGRSSARSWLFGIARRIAFRYRRSARARTRHLAATDDDTDRPEGSHEPFARAQAAQSISALLRRLDRDKRAVFVLHEVEGMTAPEVADALGIPVGTAYSRLRAAWQALGREAERERARLRRALPDMRRPDPSPERRRRAWGMIAGGLSSTHPIAPMVTAGGWLSQTKWLVVGAALGAGLLGARAAVVASSRAEREASRAEVSNEREGRPKPPRADLPPATPPQPTPAPRRAQPEPSAPPPPMKTPRTVRPRRPPATAPAPPPEDPLAVELSLIQRARQALDRARGEAALTLLQEHERRFPEGQLADERRRARIDALCLTGQRKHAEREAEALGRDPSTACP